MSNVTAESLATRFHIDATTYDRESEVDGLSVRVWFDVVPGEEQGWRWSVEGEGPEVWYREPWAVFQALAGSWEAVKAERAVALLPIVQGQRDHAGAETRRLGALLTGARNEVEDLRVKLRAADDRIDALLEQLAEQHRKAQAVYALREGAAERALTDRRALTAERNDAWRALEEARLERDEERKLVRQIAAERDALGARLTALTIGLKGLVDAYGLEEEAGE